MRSRFVRINPVVLTLVFLASDALVMVGCGGGSDGSGTAGTGGGTAGTGGGMAGTTGAAGTSARGGTGGGIAGTGAVAGTGGGAGSGGASGSGGSTAGSGGGGASGSGSGGAGGVAGRGGSSGGGTAGAAGRGGNGGVAGKVVPAARRAEAARRAPAARAACSRTRASCRSAIRRPRRSATARCCGRCCTQSGRTSSTSSGTRNGDPGCDVSGYDRDNEGHGGYIVTDILKTAGTGVAARAARTPSDPFVSDARDLATWFDNKPADIVLMHFGTNDVWNNIAPATILQRVHDDPGRAARRQPERARAGRADHSAAAVGLQRLPDARAEPERA